MCAEDCSIVDDILKNRIKSFKKWKGKIDPFEMTAGFYFTGSGNACLNFYCDLEMHNS